MAPAHAAAAVVCGLLAGTFATLAAEAVAHGLFGVATVPQSRLQRALIVVGLSTWVGLCGVATAVLVLLVGRAGRMQSEWARVGTFVGPVGWVAAIAAVYVLLRGPATLVPVAAAAGLLAVHLIAIRRVAKPVRAALRPILAAILWALTIGLRWEDTPLASFGFWSGPTILLGLAIATTLARRIGPSSKAAAMLGLLVAVSALVLESGRVADYPFLLLGMTAYFAAITIGRDVAHGGGERSSERNGWRAAILAASLVPACAGVVAGPYHAATVVAGAALAMLLRDVLPWASLPAWPRFRSETAGNLTVLALVATVALASGVPLASLVVFGLGIGIWGCLFGARPAAGDAAATGETRHRADAWVVPALMVVAVVARLAFWGATGRVWEDALITIQHAENAVAGHGLTHHPAHGRVHGFTSPLSVLVPLLGEFVRPGAALVTLRIASLVAGAGTIWIAGKIAEHPQIDLSTPAKVFWLAYLALEHSQISFGMAGMETQIWICVLLGGVAALIYGRAWWLAVALVLALLSRPEGVVWVGCALAGWLVLRGWRSALAVGGVVVAGVLPWVAFTSLYYGSPVPNTIRAKACYFHQASLQPRYPTFLHYFAAEMESGAAWLISSVPPHFVGHGLMPILTSYAPVACASLMVLLAAAGAMGMLRPQTWPVTVLLALMTFHFVAIVQTIFPWYVPPILGIFALAVASGIDAMRRVFGGRAAAWALGLGLTAWFVAPLPKTIASEGRVQRIVEEGVRRPTGLWLREHAEPRDYVTAECLGYLGYYSRLPFHDYPGLSSPRAVAALKTTNGQDRYLTPIVQQLKPTWLVLRERERGYAGPDYELVHSVVLPPRALKELNRYYTFPTNDYAFYVYRRRGWSAEPRLSASAAHGDAAH